MSWFLNFTFQYMIPYTKKDLNHNLVLFNIMIKSNMANPSLGIGLEISIVTLFLLLHFLEKKKRKRKLKRMHILSFIVLLTMATQNFPPFHLNFLHKKGGLCLDLTLYILPLVKMATDSLYFCLIVTVLLFHESQHGFHWLNIKVHPFYSCIK